MKKRFLILSIIVIIIYINSGTLLQAQNEGFKVIVNSENPVSSLTVKEVSNLFLKKTSRWSNGVKVLPADMAVSNKLREQFSKAIHGRKVSAIKAYWQKQIFSGRNVPPIEKKTERDVLRFVNENPGAIGYISVSTSTGNYRVVVLKID